MQGPFAQALICAGIAFVLFSAGLLASFGPPGTLAGEAVVRLLLTVLVPALITGFWASRSAKNWPYWRIAVTFTLILFIVLGLQAVGARSRTNTADRVAQSSQSAWGPVGAAMANEGQPGQSAPQDIQTAIRDVLIPSIKRCWLRPDAEPSEKPKLKLVLDRDGSLLAKPIVVNPSDDPLFAPYAASAIRAVHGCAPFDVLVRYGDFYDQWREVLVTFQSDPPATANAVGSAPTPVQESVDVKKNYSLIVDGTMVGIEPGETVEVTTPDGRTVTVALTRREFVTHTGEFFSFEHAGRLSTSTSDLGNGVMQHGLVTAVGTLVVVQEYRGLDPSVLTRLVLQEMTKEPKQAGATITERPTTRHLETGTVLEGFRAQAATRYETIEIEVVAIGTADHGVIALTQIDQDHKKEESVIIDRFWDSLQIEL